MKLNELKINQKAIVKSICTSGSMRRRFMDIGLIENTEVVCVGKSPSGDPSAYLIRGAVIAIRAADCAGICVKLKG